MVITFSSETSLPGVIGTCFPVLEATKIWSTLWPHSFKASSMLSFSACVSLPCTLSSPVIITFGFAMIKESLSYMIIELLRFVKMLDFACVHTTSCVPEHSYIIYTESPWKNLYCPDTSWGCICLHTGYSILSIPLATDSNVHMHAFTFAQLHLLCVHPLMYRMLIKLCVTEASHTMP